MAAPARTPRSVIRMATAGFSKRSRRGWPGASTRRRRPSRRPTIWRARCVAPPAPMASTRSEPGSVTRTGPTGTPRTWWRSRLAESCHNEPLRRDPYWSAPGDGRGRWINGLRSSLTETSRVATIRCHRYRDRPGGSLFGGEVCGRRHDGRHNRTPQVWWHLCEYGMYPNKDPRCQRVRGPYCPSRCRIWFCYPWRCPRRHETCQSTQG